MNKKRYSKRVLSLVMTVLMALSVLQLFSVTGFAATRESEPNDSFSTADVISINTSVTGNSSSTQPNWGYGDVDYYKFSTTSNGYFSISFSHEMLDTSDDVWEVRLYDANQILLESYEFYGNYTSQTTYNLGLPSATYFIGVQAVDYYGYQKDYSFKIVFNASNYWESENNDSFSTADIISVNTSYMGSSSSTQPNWGYGDVDYYKFSTMSNGYVSINFSNEMLDTSDDVWEVRLYDANQKLLESYEFYGNYTSQKSTNFGLLKGSYYIGVQAVDYFGYQEDYSFKVVFNASDYWESEPNDSFTTSDSVIINSNYTGNSSSTQPNWGYGDVDYYKFTINASGFISIKLSHPKLDTSDNVWKVRLYDANQKLLESYEFYGNYTSQISRYYELPKGTYYVGVQAVSWYGYYVDYNISINFSRYPDVSASDWYFDAVEYCSEKEYMSGYSNGRFGPGDTLKRQDFVVILARIAGANLTKYANQSSKMPDVVKGSYYAAAVNWAVDNGIIGGYQNGKFGVGDSITREQVATILYRYMGSPKVTNTNVLNAFTDKGKVSAFAKDAMMWAVQNGVISGKNSTTLAPTATASRAEIATIVMRMDKKGMF